MSNRIQRTIGVALATVASLVGVLTISVPAIAEEPVTTGWWNEVRQGNAVTGYVPQDPTYTDDGTLQVSNTPSGAAQYAALRYHTDGATGGALTLMISDNKSAEAVALVVCPTVGAWSGGGNQPWATRPKFDCSKKVAGQVSGSKVTWTLAQNVESLPGTFDFAVLPDPDYTTPFQVTLAKPDSSSFMPTGGETGSGGLFGPVNSTGSTTGSGSSGTAPTGTNGSSLPSPSGFVAPSANAPAPALASQMQGSQSGDGSASGQARPIAVEYMHDNGRALGILLIVGLLLGVVALMAYGRPLTLDGNGGTQTGGVSRFVRPRSSPPVRL